MSGRRPSTPDALLLAVTLIAVAAFVAALIDQSMPYSLWTGAVEHRALTAYWITGAALWLMLSLIAWRWALRGRGGWHRSSAGLIVVVALVSRVVVTVATGPVLSDDMYRYVHDGRTLLEGRNPYALAPADEPAFNADTNRINHPHLVTIYQPVSQYAFAGLAAVSEQVRRGTGRDSSGLDVFRLGFVAFEVVLIMLLLIALRQTGRSAWWAALYAWHPLAISEVAASGHQEPVGLAMLVGALVVFGMVRAGGGADGQADPRGSRTPPAAWVSRWPRGVNVVGSGVLLALAAAVKPVVLPLGLPMVWRLRAGGWRAMLMFAAAVGGTLLVVYLPLALMPGGLGGMLETARTFVDKWAFNASLHALAEAALGDKVWADRVMGVLLLGVLLAVTLARVDVWRAALVYLLAALLLSSTVHPWYVLWVLALLPVRFSLTVWVLSLAVMWSYAAWWNPVAYQPPTWVVWAQYVPVYAVLAVEVLMARRARRGSARETVALEYDI